MMTNNKTKERMVESHRKYILFLKNKNRYYSKLTQWNENKIFCSFSMSLPRYCLAKNPQLKQLAFISQKGVGTRSMNAIHDDIKRSGIAANGSDYAIWYAQKQTWQAVSCRRWHNSHCSYSRVSALCTLYISVGFKSLKLWKILRCLRWKWQLKLEMCF